MKNIFLVVSLCFAFLMSCNKDYTNPENLSGTEWKSYDVDENYEYFLLKFISTSQAELFIKWVTPLDNYPNPEPIASGEYSINGDEIKITLNSVMKGIINKKEMELTVYNDGVPSNTLKFVKD